MRARLAGTVATGVAFTAALGVAAGAMLSAPTNGFTGQFGSSTTTVCAIQNTSGQTRQIINLKSMWTSTASVGTITVTVGTSTDSGTTSTSPLQSTVITTVNGLDVLVPTSSVPAVYATWRNNEWFIWKSNSTTNAGYCGVSYL